MKPLKVSGPAAAELHQAITWYYERDPRVAARFASEARRTTKLIETFPQLGGFVPGVPDTTVRRLPIHSFPYHVIFVALPNAVEIVAFAHDRRRPAYFMARLRRV